MIFDPAFKRIRRLFEPGCSFSIVHLARVEWQVLVPVFTSSIVWLEASTFIKAYGLHSLTGVVKLAGKCIPVREDDARDKYSINDRL